MGPNAFVGHLLRRCHQVHHSIWTDAVGGVLTSPQYSVLFTVAAAQGEVDQLAVGRAAGLDRTTVAGVIRRLEEQGWLRRARDLADARRQVISLPVPARVALDGLSPAVLTVQQRFLEPLDAPDREWLTARLAVLANLPSPGGDHRPGHLIRLAQQHHTSLWAEELDGEITGPQFAALQVLDADGPLGQGAVAERAALDRSSASDVLGRLESRGWIQRRPDPTDRRTREVTLTDDGRAVVRSVWPAVQRVQARILAPLDPADRGRVTAALATIAGSCGPPLARGTGGQ